MLNWMRNMLGNSEYRVDGARAWDLVKSGATLVDVRTPEEFAGGSVPDATNIPVQVLNARMAEIPRGNPVVVFCRSGGRSANAASSLRSAGYEVYDAGGIRNLR